MVNLLERIRLLSAALVFTAFVAVFSYSFLIDREVGWPVSSYTMFADGRSRTPFRTYGLVGVLPAAEGAAELRLRNRDLAPFDYLRATDSLSRMTPAQQADVLRFFLSRNHRFTAIRLYHQEWQTGAQVLLSQKLLAEVAR